MDAELTDTVLLEANDGVLTITLNRPHKRNAVNRALAEGVSAGLDQLDNDPMLRVGIITGAGQAFCSGLDLVAFSNGESARSASRGFAGIVEMPPTKPLIGAVEGYALGGGFEIALCCDILIASRTATFGLPEVKRGLVARGGGAIRLPHRVPYTRAMELLLTGDPIGAEEAHAHGLVNQLAEPGQTLAVASEVAAGIAQNAPLAVSAVKRIVNEAPRWRPEDAFSAQNEILDPVFASEDASEGARAFFENRHPQWRGR